MNSWKILMLLVLIGIIVGSASAAGYSNFTPIMTSNTAPAGNVSSASSELSAARAAWYGFNGIRDSSDFWAASTTSMPQHLQIQIPTGKAAVMYNISSFSEVNAPKDFTFKGSNNGVAWTTLDTQTGITGWTNSVMYPKSFNFTNINTYTYYQLNITAGNSAGDVVLIDELVIYELAASTNPIANFTSNKTGGPIPLHVGFTDNSGNYPNVWNWSVNSTAMVTTWTNRTVNTTLAQTFSSAGIYNVTLYVANTTTGSPYSSKTMDIYANTTTTADFACAPTSGYATLAVSCVDMSIPADIYLWSWEFGDGDTSTDRNPAHSYATPGLYTVNLTVTNPDGTDKESKSGYINVTAAPNPNPYSEYRVRGGNGPLTNTSRTNITMQMVNVSAASYARGSITFNASTLYITGVFANKSTYADNTLTSYVINNSTGNVIWNTTRASGYAPGSTPTSFVDVQLVQKSYATGSTTPTWSTGYLGNSTYNSTNAVAIYSTSALSYDTWETYSNFTVSNYTPVISRTNTLFAPRELNYTADRFLWNFGDGQTFLDANGTSVSHTYTSAFYNKTLYPSLTAYLSYDTAITNTTTLTINPVLADDHLIANFTGTPTSGSAGLLVSFTDYSEIGNTTGLAYNWSYGDGTYSSDVGNTVHVYSAVGTYTVKLTLTNAVTTNTMTKSNYVIISNQQTSTWYTQHLVQLKAVDKWGNPLDGANITVQFLSSSLPDTSTSWIETAFGVSPAVADEMSSGTYVMQDLAGEDGAATFMMFPGFRYGVTITDTPLGVNHYTTILPADSTYLIYCPTAEQLSGLNVTQMQLVNTSLFITEPNLSYVTFNIVYQDTSALTTNVKWYVEQWDNRTVMYSNDLGNPGVGSVTDNFTVPNIKGQEWKFWYNATRSSK